MADEQKGPSVWDKIWKKQNGEAPDWGGNSGSVGNPRKSGQDAKYDHSDSIVQRGPKKKS